MIERHYVPSWCGDYHLDADGDTKSRLVVTDPTTVEQEQLEKFLVKCIQKKWLHPFKNSALSIPASGTTKIAIEASIVEAGKVLLAKKGRQRTGIITAIKSVGGVVEAVLGDGEKLDAALKKPEAKTAVTVRRPTNCCPKPVTGPDVRASAVLQAFCTPQQWADWTAHGFLRAYGQLSGHRYRIAHRHSALARHQKKIVWDESGDHLIHAYDWSVPPAEEVLTMKLAIEHAEPWIRNPSTVFAFNDDVEVKYRNPFVSLDRQGLDGTIDAANVRGFGHGLRAGFALMQKLKR
jgi:hypothetical protein